MCLALVEYNFKERRLSGNFFAKRFLLDVCIGATLQIGHDWKIDFFRKLILISIFRNLFGEHVLIYVLMSILLINFAWFWSKRCFQIPGPGVRRPLLYNKCRTCTIITFIYFNLVLACFNMFLPIWVELSIY